MNENKPGPKIFCRGSTLTFFFIQSLIDRIRAQARGQVFDSFLLNQNRSHFFPDRQIVFQQMNRNIVQAKPVECRACSERARETPNMACCRCQDEDAFCNNDVAKVGFVSTKIL